MERDKDDKTKRKRFSPRATHRKRGHLVWKMGGWDGGNSVLRRNHECFEIHLKLGRQD